MKTWYILSASLLLVLMAGCFPESEGQLPNFSLRIPLEQLGGAVSEEGLNSWSRWRTLPQEQRSVYEMDFYKRNFFLGLHLNCREGDNAFIGTDQMIQIMKDDTGRQYMELFLLVGQGVGCRFTVSIYLALSGQTVELFSGSSEEIADLLRPFENPVEINASLHPRATAVCTDMVVTSDTSYKFGAMDIDEFVMLPAIDAKATGGKVSFSMPGLPVGRRFVLRKAVSDIGTALVWEDTEYNFVLTTIDGVQEVCIN